jgi:hypothetical protein
MVYPCTGFCTYGRLSTLVHKSLSKRVNPCTGFLAYGTLSTVEHHKKGYTNAIWDGWFPPGQIGN